MSSNAINTGMKKSDVKKVLKTQKDKPIRVGVNELKILKYINIQQGRYFKKVEAVREIGIARTTFLDNLKRLKAKGLVINDSYSYHLSGDAKQLVNKAVESTIKRNAGDNKRLSVSTHNIKYKLELTDTSMFNEEKLKELNPNIVKKNNGMKNFTEYFVYFDDVLLRVKKNTVEINVKEIITKDVSESAYYHFQKATEYVEKLSTVGLIGRKLMLQDVHYAKVQGYLAQSYQKYGEHYFWKLGDGQRVWVDKSTGVVEEETNKEDLMERIDDFTKDMITSDGKVSDIDVMKNIFGDVLRHATMNEKRHEEVMNNFEKTVSMIGQIAQTNQQTAKGLQVLTEYLGVAHTPQKVPEKSDFVPDYFG